MKVGDFVKDKYVSPASRQPRRVGVLISESNDRYVSMALNRAFKVLWRDGTIGKNVWEYDLEVYREDR